MRLVKILRISKPDFDNSGRVTALPRVIGRTEVYGEKLVAQVVRTVSVAINSIFGNVLAKVDCLVVI